MLLKKINPNSHIYIKFIKIPKPTNQKTCRNHDLCEKGAMANCLGVIPMVESPGEWDVG